MKVWKVNLLENFKALEVLVTGDKGRVLVFAAEVFKIGVLVNGETEKDLIMHINLLLSIIMWIQRSNRLIHDLNSSLLCCLYKIIINLCVSSVSLYSLKHRSWGQLLARLEFFVPVSLVLLINSKNRRSFSKTQTLLHNWFWAVSLRCPVLWFQRRSPEKNRVCLQNAVQMVFKCWSELWGDLIDKTHERVRVRGANSTWLQGIECRSVAGFIDKESKLIACDLVVDVLKGFEFDVEEVSTSFPVWGHGVILGQANALDALDKLEGVELYLFLVIVNGRDGDGFIIFGRASDLIDVFLDFLLHYFVVFLELFPTLLKFDVLIFLLLLFCYLENLALHVLRYLSWHRSLADWSLLVRLLCHYLQDWRLIENLLEPSEMSLCCSFIVLIFSHENSIVWDKV